MTKAKTLKSVGASALAVAVLFTAFAAFSANAEEPGSLPCTGEGEQGLMQQMGKNGDFADRMEGDSELRAERRAEAEARRAQNMEEHAAELGISVEELAADHEANRAEHMQERANELGISVDELQERFQNNEGMNHGKGGANAFGGSMR